MNEKPKYYKCIESKEPNQFTVNKIYKIINPSFLIWRKSKKPKYRENNNASSKHRKQMNFGNSRNKHHREPYKKYNHSRTKIRLKQD